MVIPREKHGDKHFDFKNNNDVNGMILYYINERGLRGCPHVKLTVGGKEIFALLDSGAEISVLSGSLFGRLTEEGLRIFHIPVVNAVLLSAWGAKTKRTKKQALVEFGIGCGRFEMVFMVAPQLTTDMILGADFLDEYHVVMNFSDKSFVTVQGEVSHRHSFFYNGTAGSEPDERFVSNPDHRVNHSQSTISMGPSRSERHASVRSTNVTETEVSENRVEPDEDNIKVNHAAHDSGWEFPATEAGRSERQFDNERAEIPDDEIENINRTSNPKYRRDASAGRIVSNDGVTGGPKFQELRQTSNARMGDTRSISVCELREKVNEAVNLRDDQRKQLFDVLLNYKEYFTKQPGKCKLMRYKFEVASPEPIVGSTRPIPFSVSAEVRTQIEQLFRDGIIEYSDSTFF
jgi:hypothetical protein